VSLTVQTVLALALQCAPPTAHPEELAHVLTGIAMTESHLNPTATHRNANGTTDVGLEQVNSIHLGRPIGYRGHVITEQSLLDPCENIAASGTILLSGLSAYNTGSPTRGIANGYALRAVAAISQVMDKPAPVSQPAPPGLTLDQQVLTFTRHKAVYP
jgi:hypothetical protein